MDTIILIAVCLLSFAGLVALLAWRVSYNRQHRVSFQEVGDYSISHLIVDYIAFRLVYFCKQVVVKSYLFLLFFLRNSLSVIRYLIIRLEKRFYRFTDSLKEKEKIIHQGEVSSFLKEIREHKEKTLAEAEGNVAKEEEERLQNDEVEKRTEE